MNIPMKYKPRVEEFYKDEDGYWLHLAPGWCWDSEELHTIHEYTQKETLQALRNTFTCNCGICRENIQKQFEKYLYDNGFKITGRRYHKDYNAYYINKDNATIEYKVFSGNISFESLTDSFKDCWETKAMYEKSRTTSKTRPPRNAANTKLKAMRIDRGLTQAQLAEAAGINMRVLQHYEQGSKSFDSARLDVILKVCIALKCQISDVLDHKGDIALYKEYSKMFKKESDKA